MVAIGQEFEGFAKGQILSLDDKAQDVPASTATETIKELILGVYLEGWGLFLMERAQTQVPVADATQLHHLSHHIHDIRGILNQRRRISMSGRKPFVRHAHVHPSRLRRCFLHRN